MKLTSFHVQGFKSLVDVKLDDLQDINVFHGPNNVGKSNILQAMELFFSLLSPEMLGQMASAELPWTWGRIFNVFHPEAITLTAGFELGEKIEGYSRAEVTMKITPALPRPICRLTMGRLEGPVRPHPAGPGASGASSTVPVVVKRPLEFTSEGDFPLGFGKYGAQLVERLWRVRPDGRPVDTYALIDSLRRTGGRPETSATERIVPQSLRDALFYAKEDSEVEVREKWLLFQEAFRRLPCPLGPLEFGTTFSKDSRQADLLCIVNGGSVLLDDLGTGIQQLVALVGHLLTTEAKIVAVEEPELNLSIPTQEILHGMLERMLDDPAGPEQLLITSHSPVFEGQRNFYRVWMEDHETKVEALPGRYAHRETGSPARPDLESLPPQAEGTHPGYVTSEGLVQIPAEVLCDMNAVQGNYVYFAKHDDGFWRVIGPREWDRLMEGLNDESSAT